MTLKIAYLTGEYPRATDTFIQREVAALREHGLEVATCSIRRTGPEHHVGEEQRQEAARTFHVLDGLKRPGMITNHLGALVRSPARYLRALALAWRTAPRGLRGRFYNLIYFAEAGVLAAYLRRMGADYLHNHIAKSSCTVAMLASEISGVPYSFTLHGPDIFFEPLHWRLDEKIARAAFVACISDFCRSQGMAFSDPAHWPKLHIVHCGVDPARYDAPERVRGKQMLFVGRLAAVKGVPVLFEAMAMVPEGHLALIGDGPDRARLEQRAIEMGLRDRVSFLGYRSQTEVAEMLKETDLLVLPSFAEGVPVVLMEAMAARVPVVTTRIAGVPELVEDRVSGRLCAPGDPEGLARAICDVLSDPEGATRMGEAGRAKVVDAFDSHAEAGRLAGLFHAYAAGQTPPKRLPDSPSKHQSNPAGFKDSAP
ncbi:MAG: colanic acid biosynthesis glycosyltransferase WcaL [Rhodobacterales bacterium]|nr:MAG: colanic acid biosynthesis glycosyltransferase WcaL [Rhodobacterales bacterium]